MGMSVCTFRFNVRFCGEAGPTSRPGLLVASPVRDLDGPVLNSFLERGRKLCPAGGLRSVGGRNSGIVLATRTYDIGDRRQAAWSYRHPNAEVSRISDFVSFEPDTVFMQLDGPQIHLAP